MIDRLDVAIALIQEAKETKKRLDAMEKELSKVGCNWAARHIIKNKYSPVPLKSTINDNLKIARRILKDEYVKG